MAKPSPSWRDLEAALLRLLHDYGFEITESRGDRFIALRQGTAPSVEYLLEDFARQLEKELER